MKLPLNPTRGTTGLGYTIGPKDRASVVDLRFP